MQHYFLVVCTTRSSSHLDTQGRVFDGGHHALLCVKAKLFSATRDRRCPLEVFKRLPPCDDLLRDPVLSVGSVLSHRVFWLERIERDCRDMP